MANKVYEFERLANDLFGLALTNKIRFESKREIIEHECPENADTRNHLIVQMVRGLSTDMINKLISIADEFKKLSIERENKPTPFHWLGINFIPVLVSDLKEWDEFMMNRQDGIIRTVSDVQQEGDFVLVVNVFHELYEIALQYRIGEYVYCSKKVKREPSEGESVERDGIEFTKNKAYKIVSGKSIIDPYTESECVWPVTKVVHTEKNIEVWVSSREKPFVYLGYECVLQSERKEDEDDTGEANPEG